MNKVLNISRRPKTPMSKSRRQEPMAKTGACHDTIQVTTSLHLRQWIISEPLFRRRKAMTEFRKTENKPLSIKHRVSHTPRFAHLKKPTALSCSQRRTTRPPLALAQPCRACTPSSVSSAPAPDVTYSEKILSNLTRYLRDGLR